MKFSMIGSSKQQQYILRFDDIAPGMAWTKFLAIKKVATELGVKSVLGVVPECRDDGLVVEPLYRNFFGLIRSFKAYGDTIAQHGTYHIYDSSDSGILKINDRSEFAGHDYRVQYERILLGKNIMVSEGVWHPVFMAPAHSFDLTTLMALSDLGFESVTDGYGFCPYRIGKILFVPQLTARPLRGIPGLQTLCVHVNTLTNEACSKLIRFIERNSESFVDFKDVSACVPNDGLGCRLGRFCSALTMRAYREVRRLLNQMR